MGHNGQRGELEQTYIGTHRLTRDTQSSSHNIDKLRYIEEEMTDSWTTGVGSTT